MRIKNKLKKLFSFGKNRKETKDENNIESYLEVRNINDEIIDHFKNHGIDTELKGSDIRINFDEKITIHSKIQQKKVRDGYISRLDINIKMPCGKFIQESFGDFGTDKETLRYTNLNSFIANDFHVLLSAFNEKIDEQTFVDEWKIGENIYEVHVGGHTLKSTEEFKLPENLFEKTKELLKREKLNDKYHTVRFFYSNTDKNIGNEFLIDNELKAELMAELVKLDWENKGFYYSVRNFMILKKKADKKIHINGS